ncbi:MAG: hypothetical protein WCP04_03485 [Pseudomonadota bacterium]|jgi:hypothetical protein
MLLPLKMWRPCAGLLLLGLCAAADAGAAPKSAPVAPTPPVPLPSNDPLPPTHRPYHATRQTEGAKEYYFAAWGVDHLQARLTSSDNLVKFTYRVLDPKRAAALGDRAATPEMVALRSNAVLSVPTMEKIGPLRQASAREVGKEYWMVFSNKGHLVRSGDRVNVIIGKFVALDLVVE